MSPYVLVGIGIILLIFGEDDLGALGVILVVAGLMCS